MTLGVGVLLGARHAVDADHLVVVATMLERERGFVGALRTAALWSAGHSFTFLGVGLGIVALGLRVPPAFERIADFAVALMLIALGVFHWRRSSEPASPPTMVRPIFAGVVHGLAGSAAIALMALTTIQTVLGAILYLFAFGIGTVVGMVASTTLLSFPLGLSRKASPQQRRAITAFASAASIGLGLVLGWHACTTNEIDSSGR